MLAAPYATSAARPYAAALDIEQPDIYQGTGPHYF
jgi:hypothetical protein